MIVAFNKSSNKQKTTTHSTDEFYLCCIVTANGHPLYLHLYFITMLNGLGQEYEKTLAKHRVAKTCSHTSEKNITSELFPLNESQRFQLCSPAIKKKKTRSMDNPYCLPSYQIPPVFLNYLPITNNNNGLSMSKAFTSK